MDAFSQVHAKTDRFAFGSHKRPVSRNKQWVAGEGSGARTHHSSTMPNGHWRGSVDRGSRGRGRGGRNKTFRALPETPMDHLSATVAPEDDVQTNDTDGQATDVESEEEEDNSTPEERERFYQELVKARETERKKAIAEGKMDDPNVPKRLEDAINVVGTCMDMCPRFERYRRERENNLTEFEMIPGTKRVNHKRAVKMYERAAGDKIIPSDLRPPEILKKTLDYLFHELIPEVGFSKTFSFVRDRSRAVRNDFTMQHETGRLAIECHDRCARFHILAIHHERGRAGFSIPLEEQQLMYTLQSLKEFYEDQRGRYESPTELEMRVYHRLIHIRDQKERHEDIPRHIVENSVFNLTTQFRLHVQKISSPITKTSILKVDEEGMQIFSELATVLMQQGNVVMIYLVACVLERLFGPETIEGIEDLKGNLSIPDIIDGALVEVEDEVEVEEIEEEEVMQQTVPEIQVNSSQPSTNGIKPSVFLPPGNPPSTGSAFANLSTTPNVFGTTSVFGTAAFGSPDSSTSMIGTSSSTPNISGSSGSQKSIFGTSSSVPTFGSSEPPKAAAYTLGPTMSAFGSLEPQKPALNGFVPSSLPSSSSTSQSDPEKPRSIFGSNPSVSSINSLNQPPIFGSTPIVPKSNPFLSITPSASFAFSTGSSAFPTSTSFPQPPTDAQSQTITAIPSPLQPFPTSQTDPSSIRELHSNGSILDSVPASKSMADLSYKPSHLPATTSPQSTPILFSREPSVQSPVTSLAPSLLAGKRPIIFPRASTSAPSILKINTSTLSDVPSSPLGRTPPPAPKTDTIALPVTPSMMTPHASAFSNRPGLQNDEILSPLVLSSPSVSRMPSIANFPANGAIKVPDRRGSMSPEKFRAISTSRTFPGALDKGKQVANRRSSTDMELEAKAFTDKLLSNETKRYFSKWRQKASEHSTWLEACQHSEQYSKKRREQKAALSRWAKKRRLHTVEAGELSDHDSSPTRSTRRGSSQYKPPISDDALAERLKQNRVEHEARWAKGSFLNIIKNHIHGNIRDNSLPLSRTLWLSMNPDNDGTAIWMERKFAVPDSGSWHSETIFSVALSTGSMKPSPALIVFECTPPSAQEDDIERKMRVLDDCARLRDIFKFLPKRRYFSPSLLFISWDTNVNLDLELSQMVEKATSEQKIEDHRVLIVSVEANDLDDELAKTLGQLVLDFSGKLAHFVPLRRIFKFFDSTFDAFVTESVGRCTGSDDFDWRLFGIVVRACVQLLNSMAASVQLLTRTEGSFELLADVILDEVVDDETMYRAAFSWFSNSDLDAARDIEADLQSHQMLGRGFPAQTFIEQLRECLIQHSELSATPSAATNYAVLKADVSETIDAFRAEVNSQSQRLHEAFSASIRRSPKRRSLSSAIGSVSSSATKRRRMSPTSSNSIFSPSASAASVSPPDYLRDTLSPDLSASADVMSSREDSQQPVVTVAMLRALTKSLRGRYSDASDIISSRSSSSFQFP